MSRSPTALDWFALLALTIFWGTSFVFIEMALEVFPPSVLVSARIVLGGGVLLVVMMMSGVSWPRSLRTWMIWGVISILGIMVPMRLTTWGQLHISSAETGVLMAISPLFVYSLSHWLLPGERMTLVRFWGFLVGFTGVVLVLGPDSFGSIVSWDGDMHLLGMLAVLGAAISYSMNSVFTRRAASDQAPMALAVGTILLAALFSLPSAISDLGQIQPSESLQPYLALIILGIICSAFASLLFFRLIQGPGPMFTTLVTYLVPVWAILAGAFILQEQLEPRVYLGLGLILSGIALSEVPALLSRRRARAISEERVQP